MYHVHNECVSLMNAHYSPSSVGEHNELHDINHPPINSQVSPLPVPTDRVMLHNRGPNNRYYEKFYPKKLVFALHCMLKGKGTGTVKVNGTGYSKCKGKE